MLFTSYKYGAFVLVAFALVWLVVRFARKPRATSVALLVLSYVFYALWDWRWCALLAAITASGFFGGLWLEAGAKRGRQQARLAVLVVFNLCVLGAFKYFDFFAGSFAKLLAHVGLHADHVTLGLILPIGLSYYTFQNLSYIIDVHRRTLPAARDVVTYACSLAFFPQLLAGPITRPRDLMPQLARRREFDGELASDGLRQVLWGLFKKMVIADNIGTRVDAVWAARGHANSIDVLCTAVLYSVQIYCDFSGYADIAIGTAKLFGLRLSPNFEYPYFSVGIRAFWRRWHMTLSSWARDYVYISLGGNRVSRWRRSLNVMLIFLAIGLWHGANWTFIVWGGLHGLYNIVESTFRLGSASRRARAASWRSSVAWGIITFAAVTFAWIFFRAPSVGAAFTMLSRLAVPPAALSTYRPFLPLLLASAGLFVYEWFTRGWEHGLAVGRLALPARWAAYLATCLVLLLSGYLGSRAGIYVLF
jgi:D-alanyl-lipoteichoic acid acyltransferase DltB (MBOAT superfamily)